MYALDHIQILKLTNASLRLSEQCVFGLFHWGGTGKHSACRLCTLKAQLTLFLLPEPATSQWNQQSTVT